MRVLAAAALALVVTAPVGAQEKTLAETCTELTPAEVKAIENYKGEFAENALYARSYCVSVEEAERRMAIQQSDAIGAKTEPGPPPAPPANSIGSIAAALAKSESATFAGLWIEHRPRHRVAVAFTRDAAKTLAKYTRDPMFEAIDRPGPTLAELDATMERLMKVFAERGYRFASAGRTEQHGTLVFELAQEAAPIRAAAARGEFELPSWVELKEPRPLPFPAPPAVPGDPRVKAFPQLKHRTDMYPTTLVGVPPTPATLELRDGCLVLVTRSGSQVALWSAEDALDVSAPKQVSVISRLTGVRIRVGDRVSLNGLQPGIQEARSTSDKVGESAACPGPYYVVNGYELQADHEAQRREARILSLMHQHKLSRSAAEGRYAAERKRIPELQSLRSRLLRDHGDRLGGAWVNEEEATAHLFLLPGTDIKALVPASLRPHVTSQTVPRNARELDAAKAKLEAQLTAAGIKARLDTEVIGGFVQISGVEDLRALSAAAVSGKIAFPPFARLTHDNALPLGGYNGIGWDDLLQRYEKAPEFNRIRALVAATSVPGYGRPGRNERPLEKPSRAQSLDVAHWLVAYGFDDADRLGALQAAGADPVDAWVRQNGLSTPRNRAILAEQVVIAEPVTIDLEKPGKDGYRSEVTWRIVETLKGSVRPGEILKQRLISGEDKDGSLAISIDEPLLLPGLPGALEKGSRWVLHLSSGLYRHQSLLVVGEGAAQPNVYASWQAPARVFDNKVYLLSSDQQPVTLEALRKEIAPVQEAFARAGSAR